ncbi:cation-translocating P-type ATPase [Phytohabitans rumicis]|nr:cation-transporting P-type ATPase [Phytohabitans rumicis]
MAMTTAPAAARGLTAQVAAARLRADGPNTVTEPPRRHLATRILHQLTDPLVALLLAAGVVTTALGDFPDTAIIALVVIVNTVIGVTQEVRADRAIAALDRMAAPTARVMRDGVDQVVPAADLVRADLVHLEPGDVIPADLRLDAAHRLQVDEAALTGESVPVHRGAGDEAFAGTVVVTGRGVGTVVRTGPASALGRIATLVATTRPGPTPLQRRLTALGRVLGLTAVVLSAVVLVLGLAAGRPLVDMAITAVSLVVAAVPESLPAVVTLALALGARRMAGLRAIPRRLHAVETLGSVTVVASDKTGTLTEGRMAVQRAVTAGGEHYRVRGQGYAPYGELRDAADTCTVEPGSSLRDLARAATLCSDATLAPPGDDRPQWTAVGDPLEAALVAFAARSGLDPAAERAAWPRVAEEPFEQETRRMVTVHRHPDGGYLVVCKGAPESVLASPFLDDVPADALPQAQRLAEEGLRVLAVATAVVPALPDPRTVRGLRLVGLVAVGDPVRETAPHIAAAFGEAGIRLVLITGDHAATAAAIGGRLGIWAAGDAVARGDDGAIDPRTADEVRVFARIQPEQKLDIVTALQARGHVVAMTGDGVNDAPALRRADIGVAMGGGTEVARQAADLVLVDDNLATVGTAVREGRRIYDNIRRFLRYGLSGGLAEILVMLLGPAFGLAVPLLPAQILWVNLLTHGVPGVALGAEPAEPGTMRRAPRSPQESVLGAGLLRAVLLTGGLLAAVVLGAGIAADALDRPWQSIVFVVLGLAQLGVALAVRASRTPIKDPRTPIKVLSADQGQTVVDWRSNHSRSPMIDGEIHDRRAGVRRWRGRPRNPALLAAVGVSALLQVAGVLLPPLRELLGTEPLTAAELVACAAVATLPGLTLRLSGFGHHRPPGRSR